ncbi:MAG: hypothetical protein WDN28_00615 [Chthoniobacter sp.]
MASWSPARPASSGGCDRKLLADPASAQRLGEQGRVSAVEKFAVEKTTSVLKHLLVNRIGLAVPPTAEHAIPSCRPPGFSTVYGNFWINDFCQ